MKPRHLIRILSSIALLLSTASLAFGFASKPSQPPGAPPYGVNMQGAAAGTKLTGTISLVFGPLSASSDAACRLNGVDLGVVNATLKLRKAGGTLGNNQASEQATATLGIQPIYDPGAVQTAALAAFRQWILGTFFGGDSSLSIYTKDVSDFVTSVQYDPSAVSCTFFYDLVDGTQKVVAFTTTADVVLAVK